jgi:hypothetical protein
MCSMARLLGSAHNLGLPAHELRAQHEVGIVAASSLCGSRDLLVALPEVERIAVRLRPIFRKQSNFRKY